jgi:hypothetical protein
MIGAMRHVRGVLFVDYVRMLRSSKAVDWGLYLPAEDLHYLGMKIEPDVWYPMATFERMGNEILRTVGQGKLFVVQLWGRHSAGRLAVGNPQLVAPGDPNETLNRFHALRQTFFDFDALQVPILRDEEAQIVIRYHMGMPAEEAAAHQTMGFFEGLLALAGAVDITADFVARSWLGDAQTLVVLRWSRPGAN